MNKSSFIEIRKNFYCIEHAMSHDVVRSFFIIGDDYALLIDTGLAHQELKEQLETLTSLPISVIFTHSDKDHMGDAHRFDRRFMHPDEVSHYLKREESPLSFIPIRENEVIICGDYQFEVLLIPGHTPGHIALLESHKRFMIGGDSFQKGPIFMMGEGRDFEKYLNTLMKIDLIKNDIDVIYASHHALEFNPQDLPLLIMATQKMITHQLIGQKEELFGRTFTKYQDQSISFYA